jgi:hypothetical protein
MTTIAAKTASAANSRTEGSGIRRRSDWIKFMEINVSKKRAFHSEIAPILARRSSAVASR